MEEKYLRPRDVAATLGVSRQAIYKWIRESRLTSVKFGRAVRIPRTALADFIKQEGKAMRAGIEQRLNDLVYEVRYFAQLTPAGLIDPQSLVKREAEWAELRGVELNGPDAEIEALLEAADILHYTGKAWCSGLISDAEAKAELERLSYWIDTRYDIDIDGWETKIYVAKYNERTQHGKDKTRKSAAMRQVLTEIKEV